MLVDMLNFGEVIQEHLPDLLKFCAALATVVAVLDDHDFRMLTATFVSVV